MTAQDTDFQQLLKNGFKYGVFITIGAVSVHLYGPIWMNQWPGPPESLTDPAPAIYILGAGITAMGGTTIAVVVWVTFLYLSHLVFNIDSQ